ncbi:hypothetical protein Xoosp13_78 [Xanthomonas phage Xoo-sp13]|nr:hypothetical protein Xoosp13_78 [Xanthomonas phage Xoo-sp13]
MSDDAIKRQRNEFDAVLDLVNAYNSLAPIVDDDYPETRYRYEMALGGLVEAMKANERFVAGNRFHLAVK